MIAEAESMSYSVLTPYLVPFRLQSTKKRNIGDGFILKSIKRLLHPHECSVVLTSRDEPSEEQIQQINSTKALILAGANQLTDTYSVIPKLGLRGVQKIKVPIIPFAIGIDGHEKLNRSMSRSTKTILSELHSRIKFSAWRCPMTIEYLRDNLPEFSTKYLMTGCAVAYDESILNGTPFSANLARIVVTVTERDDFWERETNTIDYVAERFERSTRVLSLHQAFDSQVRESSVKALFGMASGRKSLRTPSQLHRYAMERGFEIYIPEDVDECQDFYRSFDLHIGSRLHAHLYFLSQAKRSFLTYVDGRMKGFAQAYGFPVCDHRNLDRYLSYDFEHYRANNLHHYHTMQMFVNYVSTEIL